MYTFIDFIIDLAALQDLEYCIRQQNTIVNSVKLGNSNMYEHSPRWTLVWPICSKPSVLETSSKCVKINSMQRSLRFCHTLQRLHVIHNILRIISELYNIQTSAFLSSAVKRMCAAESTLIAASISCSQRHFRRSMPKRSATCT